MAATNESPEVRLALVESIKLESTASHSHQQQLQQKAYNSHHLQTTGSSSETTLAASKTMTSSDIPNFNNTQQNLTSTAIPSAVDTIAALPPVVYGELSILGYNGYIPNVERNGRRNRSKFLLCKRTEPNGIKKSRHYIVKQPQATKAIQDKDLHSISYTFSRSQTIIVEYRQDENTDMFQIGRSSEDPIDFVVMDTISNNVDPHLASSGAGSSHHHHHHHHHHSSSSRHINENNTNSQYQLQPQQMIGGDVMGMNRFHRNLAKVGEDALHYGAPPPAHEPRSRLQYHTHLPQAVLLNYPQPNLSNLPPMMAEHFRNQDSSFYQPQQHQHQQQHHSRAHRGHSSGSHQQQPQQMPLQAPPQMRNIIIDNDSSSRNHRNDQPSEQCPSNRHGCGNNNSSNGGNNLIYKRSHATQSTISRFACRILVDRVPPYTARIYAAGFDSSKNIFLGEKATKWEQDNSIDGLTTNGVLLMHPKRGNFYGTNLVDEQHHIHPATSQKTLDQEHCADSTLRTGSSSSEGKSPRKNCSMLDNDKNNTTSELNNASTNENHMNHNNSKDGERTKQGSSISENSNSDKNQANKLKSTNHYLHLAELSPESGSVNDANNNSDRRKNELRSDGGIWREVSVDGGIYAIRESRSAAQKGTRIESESNILQDGTLIDLCGATLLWRSVEGFKAAPTKLSLEEKIDLLNASRPQCPVGLNTLVIPRKPIPPTNHHHRSGGHKEHHLKDSERNSHQPYVYLKCGHVQGYHNWGATEKTNQRTCPICMSVGMVAKLSMGLEPSFYVDSGPLSHAFNPCGHMASERTIRYWCSIKIPHGTHFFHAICPFCASPLASSEPASTRLIFQDDLD